ncbi:MAG: Nif11 family protein [Paludibacter sp.]|nr:Nif11 family protein [Paludibacter sp.]
MSVQNAINFISKVDSDNEFRKSCYKYKTQSELFEYMTSRGLKFDAEEIEDAFNVLELKCQTYEQAGRVHEVKAWFRLFK